MEIRLVQDSQEYHEVSKFWYEIYVRQMKRSQKYADHVQQTICEPLDTYSRIFVAWEQGKIAGTLRVNLAQEGDLGYYHDLYDLHSFTPFYPDHIAIITKLMFAPEHRNKANSNLLFQKTAQWLIERNVDLVFADCNDYLLKYFYKLGGRRYKENVKHPEYGHVIPLVFVFSDIKYLNCIQSPLASIIQNGKIFEETVKFFYENYGAFCTQAYETIGLEMPSLAKGSL